MVNALKNEPGLGGWDIINEMEGVITPGQYNRERCFDTRSLSGTGAGWKGHLYSAQELLRYSTLTLVLLLHYVFKKM